MTKQQLEEKIIELLANAESYEDAMKELAAYVREEPLREVICEETCPECGGAGWNTGFKLGHGCDGTDECCSRVCPIQVPVPVGCECCWGTGKIQTLCKS